jgi:hypothetical protein
VFIGGSLWICLVGLAFALVGFWMIAPTRLDIERKQREITAAGSPAFASGCPHYCSNAIERHGVLSGPSDVVS